MRLRGQVMVTDKSQAPRSEAWDIIALKFELLLGRRRCSAPFRSEGVARPHGSAHQNPRQSTADWCYWDQRAQHPRGE